MTSDPRIGHIEALLKELDAEAEADPNGGFGSGMQLVIREVRGLLQKNE